MVSKQLTYSAFLFVLFFVAPSYAMRRPVSNLTSYSSRLVLSARIASMPKKNQLLGLPSKRYLQSSRRVKKNYYAINKNHSLIKKIIGFFGVSIGLSFYNNPLYAEPFYSSFQNSQKKIEAQCIKARIDNYILACLSSNYWNSTISFAETIDLCIEELKKNQQILDNNIDIFYINQPEDWKRYTVEEIIELLQEIRDETCIRVIGKKLYNLFYLLPEDLQKNWKTLPYNLYCRLKVKPSSNILGQKKEILIK